MNRVLRKESPAPLLATPPLIAILLNAAARRARSIEGKTKSLPTKPSSPTPSAAASPIATALEGLQRPTRKGVVN